MSHFLTKLLVAMMIAPVAIAAVLAPQPPAHAQKAYTTNEGYFATLTEKDLERAIRYLVENDNEALMAMVKQDRLVVLKPGLKVYLVKSAGLFASKVKIRPQGTTLELWTTTEAIK